jgi:ribosomal protein L11 methyltransferase
VIVSDLAQVLFSVPTDVAEAVANLLTEHVGSGIEQRDADTLAGPADGVIELLAWVPSSDIPAHVERIEQLLLSLAELGQRTQPWSWRSEDVDPAKWEEVYKQFFKINRLTRRVVVRPSWESYDPEPTDLVVEMDPGQAFGTGLHASTRLAASALERIARLVPAPANVLDVGCGTGILAIVAARLWPRSEVLAIDNDEIAVQVARQNVQSNDLGNRIEVAHRSADGITGQYDVITANLTHELLTRLRDSLTESLEDAGRLVLSGILGEQAFDLCRHFTADLRLDSEYSEEQSGWRVLLLRRRI